MNTVQKLAVGCQDAFDRCSWRCPAEVLSDTHWGRVALSAHPGGGSGFLGRIERFGTRISDKKARAIRLVALDCLPTNLTARNDYSLRPHTTHPTTLEAVPRRRNSAKKKLFCVKKAKKIEMGQEGRSGRRDLGFDVVAGDCDGQRRSVNVAAWLDLVTEKTVSHPTNPVTVTRHTFILPSSSPCGTTSTTDTGALRSQHSSSLAAGGDDRVDGERIGIIPRAEKKTSSRDLTFNGLNGIIIIISCQ